MDLDTLVVPFLQIWLLHLYWHQRKPFCIETEKRFHADSKPKINFQLWSFKVEVLFFYYLVASSGLYDHMTDILRGYITRVFDLLLYNTQQTDHRLHRTLETIRVHALYLCLAVITNPEYTFNMCICSELITRLYLAKPHEHP